MDIMVKRSEKNVIDVGEFGYTIWIVNPPWRSLSAESGTERQVMHEREKGIANAILFRI
jgi:hypothetical protein